VSVAQIIEEFHKLSASEQEQVLELLRKERNEKSNEADARYAENSDFKRSADKILREHADLFRRLAK
jgi:hypothetical protein